jgi:hypothetical protein
VGWIGNAIAVILRGDNAGIGAVLSEFGVDLHKWQWRGGRDLAVDVLAVAVGCRVAVVGWQWGEATGNAIAVILRGDNTGIGALLTKWSTYIKNTFLL